MPRTSSQYKALRIYPSFKLEENRNNKSLNALRMQNKIVLALLLIALAFQGINIIEKLNTPIFSDMLASTMGFVLVILNMASGSPSR